MKCLGSSCLGVLSKLPVPEAIEDWHGCGSDSHNNKLATSRYLPTPRLGALEM